MGGLVQDPRRLLAAEAADAGRSQEGRRRLFLRQFRARAGGGRRSARHPRHHRHADRCAGRPSATPPPATARASSSPTTASGRARKWRPKRRAQIADDEGLTLLHPFDDPEIVAGQAGAGLEALDQLAAKGAKADLLFCAVGGGGLIGGVALAFHYLSPATEIIGVEPAGFNSMGTSLAHGEIETMPLAPNSICDGLMARRPGVAPFAAVQRAGVKGLAVTDASVRKAMKIAAERMKLVLEPSGAASLAALIDGGLDVAGKTVLVIATGGNVSLADFMKHIENA